MSSATRISRARRLPHARALHAAFGFPVVLHGEVLSVMEFFSLEIRPPGRRAALDAVERRQSDRAVLTAAGARRTISIDSSHSRSTCCASSASTATSNGSTRRGSACSATPRRSCWRVRSSSSSIPTIGRPRRTKRRSSRPGRSCSTSRIVTCTRTAPSVGCCGRRRRSPSCRSCTPRRMTSPSERPPKKRSLTTRVISKSVTARSKNRPPGWRNWSRSSRRHGDAPKTRRKPRAPFSPT